MRKLDSKQMEKVNGGHSARRCRRIDRRAFANKMRGNQAKAVDLAFKYALHC